MSVDKINDGKLYDEDRFHVCQPDVPGKNADDMKEFMDYIPRKVIIPKINEIIDDVDSKADGNSVYLKSETYNKTETDSKLLNKADSGKVYTKTETDLLLTQKVGKDSDSIIVDVDEYPDDEDADKGVIYRYKNNLYTCNSTNDGMIQINKETVIPEEIPTVSELPLATEQTAGNLYRYNGKVYEGVAVKENKVTLPLGYDGLNPLPCAFSTTQELVSKLDTIPFDYSNRYNLGDVVYGEYEYEVHLEIIKTDNGYHIEYYEDEGDTYTLDIADWVNGKINLGKLITENYNCTSDSVWCFSIRHELVENTEYSNSPIVTQHLLDSLLKNLNSVFSNVLKGRISDEIVTIDDISPLDHELSVKVSGKNKFHFTKALNHTTVGVTTIANKNASEFILNGTSTANTAWRLSNNIRLERGTYTISISGLVDNSGEDRIYIGNSSAEVVVGTIYNGTPKTFTVSQEDVWHVQFVIANGSVYDNQTIKIQIEKCSAATEYTPFIPDISEVTVNRLGKNIFDFLTVCKSKGIPVTDDIVNSVGWQILDAHFTVPSSMNGKTVSVSCMLRSTGEDTAYSCLRLMRDKIDIKQSDRISPNGDFMKVTYTEQVQTGDIIGIGYGGTNGSQQIIYAKEFQVEIADTPTEYETCNSLTYTPNADGSVDGVTSLYPVTSLTTDTDGALIDVEYNRDINKAFEKLEQAVKGITG